MTDEQLVRQIQNGGEGFDELVKRYQDKVYGLCSRLLGDADEAADAAQEAFVKAYVGLQRFNNRSRFSTWMYRITVNHCLNVLRARRRKKVRLFSHLSTAEQQQLGRLKTGEQPDDKMEKAETAKRVADALMRLNEEQRAVVVLHRYEGLSYREISDVTGLSIGAVESRLFRARKKLAELLSEEIEGKPYAKL